MALAVIRFTASFFYFAISPAVASTDVQASRTGDFCNSLGINTHVARTQGDLAAEVAYLGFQHVRDGVNDVAAGDAKARIERFAKFGISWDIIVRTNPQQYLQFVTRNKAHIIMLEGPNEPDLENPDYGGLRGIPAAQLIQRDLYHMDSSSQVLHGVPVLNFAIGHPNLLNRSLAISDNYNFWNVHVYAPAGRPPRSILSTAIDQSHDAVAHPIVVSETGYTTVKYNMFSAAQGLEGVDESTQVKYLLDAVFDDFSSGVAQTYIYDLKDDADDPQNTSREDHFGLFHYDGTPKIAATAFHNLALILADRDGHAASFKPGKLALQISGDSNVFSTLLQKADGSSYLILWSEPEIWNVRQHRPVTPVSSRTVNVRFDAAYNLSVLDPLIGATAITVIPDGSMINVNVTDHPIILKIEPIAQN